MQKILIIRGGALGDFILTLPVIQTVKKNFPSADIDLIGSGSYPLLAENYISNVYSLTDARWLSLYTDSPLEKELKNYLQQFDLIISYIGNSEHIFNSHIKNLKGEGFLHCNPYPGIFEGHIIEHLLFPLKRLRVKEIHQPQIQLDERAKKYALKFWEEKGLYSKRAIAIHPGSGSVKKRWQVERFIELANLLQREGTNIVFILGEAEYDLKSELNKLPSETIVLLDLSIIDLAAILERCFLYIGNDSGVTHMAGALNIPTIALFGPTDPQNWGPRGEEANIIYYAVSCSPCKRAKRDACKYQRCLDAISIDEVKYLADTVIRS